MKKIFIMLSLVFGLMLVGCAGTPKDAKINVYTRDTSSGTRDCFFSTIGFSEAVSDPSKLVSGSMEVEKNDDMINSVKNDENGIGYISLSTLENSGTKGLKYGGVEATETNVLNGTYKLKRNFNFMTRSEYNTEDEKAIVEAFVAYMSTKEGKATIKAKDGIVDIKNTDKSWNDIKSQHPVAAKDNSGITIKFGGSTSVEKMIKALADEFSSKCGNFVVEQNHTGSSDAFKRTQGSEKDGANYLSIGFASRDFKSSENAATGTTGTICIDAVVVIVNKANATTNVTAETLKKIYQGTISTWSNMEA